MQHMVRADNASERTDESPETALANAIVIQAAKDYRNALRRLRKHPDSAKALNTKTEVERFFRSGWYAMFTKVDPEMLILRLNMEVSEDE